MRAEMQAARRTMLLLIINEAQMIRNNPRATVEQCVGSQTCAQKHYPQRDDCEFSNSLVVTGP